MWKGELKIIFDCKAKGTVSTYKALSSIIHQPKLEALLILKSFSKGVTQAVGGKHPLSALLKLAEYTLKKT